MNDSSGRAIDYMDSDKRIEYIRYETRAKSILSVKSDIFEIEPSYGSLTIQPIYRDPYTFYEQCIRQYVSQEHDVLELGSGTGLHTYALAQTGARVVASDISSHSLNILAKRIRCGIKTLVADMEALPCKTNSFDVVAVAGSLSYGDPKMVDAEVRRVLRPGGTFICVDSLNHNPIYRFNRWIHYLKGNRTKSTLLRMPTIARIQSISRGFRKVEVSYFGSASYLMPVLSYIIGQHNSAIVSRTIDKIVRVRRSAFKFVLIAHDRL